MSRSHMLYRKILLSLSHLIIFLLPTVCRAGAGHVHRSRSRWPSCMVKLVWSSPAAAVQNSPRAQDRARSWCSRTLRVSLPFSLFSCTLFLLPQHAASWSKHLVHKLKSDLTPSGISNLIQTKLLRYYISLLTASVLSLDVAWLGITDFPIADPPLPSGSVSC